LADGAPACPFVAFEDDRDERSSVPDHRHRCYADARPAPRALAHQEAYCLSSAFPVCPTFQDWARREAARSRGGAPTAPSASAGMNRAASGAASEAAAGDAADADGAAGAADAAGAAGAGGAMTGGALGADALGAGALGAAAGAWGEPAAGDADRARPGASSSDDHTGADGDWSGDGPHGSSGEHHPDDLARRNPPRDWAAPPPWLASAERPRDVDADPPPFLGRRTTEPGQGLVGSPADRMAGGPPPTRHDATDDGVWSSDSRTAAAAGAGLAGGGAAAPRRSAAPRDDDDVDEDEQEIRRPARRPRAYAQHLGGPDGPDWEHPRRYEAYPTIKTRVGLPAVPRIVGLLGLVVVLAIALFLLPGILNIGGSSPPAGSSPKASSVALPTSSLPPTTPPEPTPGVYTIKKGETLVRIATAHGITLEELLAANPAIKNPNKISEGQQIVIPVPSGAPPDTVGESAAP
ncbi:MAG: LysM peptidoglycan-binding domain-containing protein, partial [Candidatus Limnocylindrales bacterium]